MFSNFSIYDNKHSSTLVSSWFFRDQSLPDQGIKKTHRSASVVNYSAPPDFRQSIGSSRRSLLQENRISKLKQGLLLKNWFIENPVDESEQPYHN